MFTSINDPLGTAYSSPSDTFEHLDASTSEKPSTDAAAGECWMIKYKGEDWPVVIGDEDIVVRYFRAPRPQNALQADGKWGKAYTSGGLDEDNRSFPCVFLGMFKLTWAPARKLQHIDRELGAAIRASTNNLEVAQAWKDANSEYPTPLQKCKMMLSRQQQERGEETPRTLIGRDDTPASFSGWRSSAARHTEKRKRKGSPELRYPPGYMRNDQDDEESADLFLQPGIEPKIKKEPSASSSSTDIDGLYDDLGTLLDSSADQEYKRSKTHMSGRYLTRPMTPLKNNTAKKLGSPLISARGTRGLSQIRMKREAREHDDSDNVTIYVDNPHRQFVVKLSDLNISPLIKSLVAHHPEDGWYVMSPMLSALNGDDFLPIGQYLTRREYDPTLINDGTTYARLEVQTSKRRLSDEVVRCAMIYANAQMLQLPGLMDLAFRKLKALENMELHHAFAILVVAEMIFHKADEGFKGYLVRYLADHFWDVVLAETTKIAEIMRDNEELAEGVFGRLSGRPDGEVKVEGVVKDEVHVKAEEGKVVKKEQENQHEHGDEAVLDGQDRGKNGTDDTLIKDDAGLNLAPITSEDSSTTQSKHPIIDELAQTEKEMLRTALRESDLEATEEDLTKILQDQSQFLEAYSPSGKVSTEI